MKHVRNLRRILTHVALAACAVLAGCATRSTAPVEDRRPSPPAARAPVLQPGPSSVPPSPQAAARPAEPERPATYTVRRGDTLAGIALEHGLDYRELAAWNGIDNPNRILVGQVLRLAAPGETVAAAPMPGDTGTGVVTAPLRSAPPIVAASPTAPAPAAPRNTEGLKVAPKATKEPYSEAAAREMAKAAQAPQVASAEPSRAPAPAEAPKPETAKPATPPATDVPPPAPKPPAGSQGSALPDDEDLDWMWPTKGKLVTGFSDTANLKGIDIAGAAGQPVLASAAGRVVYAGSGLRGYGKLVIIKHNNKFLTAYAHNREIVVKEGQQVTRGQKIAEMGNTDADQVKLHFEIRRLGKPMDPLKYLPPA
jgi:lipoprotein NlpD